MKSTLVSLTTVGVLLALLGAAQADDPKAIIDKAIQARGGADKLAKIKAVSAKRTGTIHRMGMEIQLKGEETVALPDRAHAAYEADFMGQNFKVVTVVNRDKAWRKLGDNDQELEGDQLKEAQEGLHSDWVASLVPLKDAAYTLSPLPESKVGDKAVVGVKVSHKDHRDVKLFFDKETDLLVKTETRSKDAESGEEMDSETIISDYKDVDGVKFATKSVTKRGGQPFAEFTRSDIKLLDKVDDKLFEKP